MNLNSFYVDNVTTITDEAVEMVLIDMISTNGDSIEIAVLPSMWVVLPSEKGRLHVETIEGLNINSTVITVLEPLLQYCFAEGVEDLPALNWIENRRSTLDINAFSPKSTILRVVGLQ